MARSLERMSRPATDAREVAPPSWAGRRRGMQETAFRAVWPRGRSEPLSEGPAAEEPLLTEHDPAEDEGAAEVLEGDFDGDLTMVPAYPHGSTSQVTAPSGQKTKAAPPPKKPAKKAAAPAKAPAAKPPAATITSETVATAPGALTRVTIGVGEEVTLTYSGKSASWSTPAGTLSAAKGKSVLFTAPDTAQKVTVTADKATLDFTVIAPTDVHMDRFGATNVKHTKDRPDLGIQTRPFFLPDNVNFYNIKYHEVDVKPICHGVYDPLKIYGHDPAPRTLSFDKVVVAGKGTRANVKDEVYSGDPGTAAPFVPGDITYSIPYEYKVGAGAFIPMTKHVMQAITLVAPDKLTASKAGANGDATVGSPTSTY
jgi:hypothetical protein